MRRAPILGATACPVKLLTSRSGNPHMIRHILLLGAAAMAGACSDSLTPTRPAERAANPAARPTAGRLAIDRSGTVLRWNALARQLAASHPMSAALATRAYAIVSVAQFAGVEAAEDSHGEVDPSVRASIAAASAAALEYLFPDATASIEASVRDEEQGLADDGAPGMAVGDALGRAAGQQVVDRARADGADATVSLTIPIGPGYWVGTPINPQWPQLRPWLLRSGDQFRPQPPPAFGSPEFTAAFEEVVRLAANRTPEQLAILNFWNDPPTVGQHSAHWNQIAVDILAAHGASDERAARTLAIMNMAIADAAIACFDAKYFYWLVRPYQLDPTISTPLGKPPHASYPSLHACQGGAAVGVLARVFPSERASLTAMELEMDESRLWAGLHYRFDVEQGSALGHKVARYALRATRRER